jgi:hypothetical protein
MTRQEPGNDLHRAMFEAFRKIFGPHLAEHPIERTRETSRQARTSFDRAYEDFRGSALAAWDKT